MFQVLKREQIHAAKKIFFNITIFVQVNTYEKCIHRSTDQLRLNRFELSFASLNLAHNNIY